MRFCLLAAQVSVTSENDNFDSIDSNAFTH